MNDFDHSRYRGALNFLAQMAYDEYRHISLDIPKYQASLLRTYLWLSSLVATLQMGFYFKTISGEITWRGLECIPGDWFFLTAGLSLFLSLSAFVLGVDSLRGRGHETLPLGSFSALSQKAYEMALDPSSSKLYPTVINALDQEIIRLVAARGQKGRKLRAMSRLVLLSVAFSIIAATALFGTWP